MRDRREYPTDDAFRDTDDGGENLSRALSVSNREMGSGLALNDGGTNYAELFTRLQKLIDNATETIRDLRRENAELSGRVSQMDAYIQLRAETVGNEAELHQAAVRLEEVLESVGGVPDASFAPAAPVAAPALAEARPSPTPLHRVYEPVPEPRHDAPVGGYTPARETPREAALAPSPVAYAAPVPPPPPAPPVHRAPMTMPVVTMPTVPLVDESEARELAHAAATTPLHRPAHAMPAMPPPAPEPPTPILHTTDEDETREAMPVAPPAPSHPQALPVVAVAPAPEPVREPMPEPVLAPAAPVAAVRRAPIAPVAPLAPVPNGASERYAGTYTLVVYPFTRFSDLGQFQSALQELIGIHDVQVRRFAQGTLEMRLNYDGTSPLPQALRGLPIRVEDVEEEEPYRLRVRLDLNSGS